MIGTCFNLGSIGPGIRVRWSAAREGRETKGVVLSVRRLPERREREEVDLVSGRRRSLERREEEDISLEGEEGWRMEGGEERRGAGSSWEVSGKGDLSRILLVDQKIFIREEDDNRVVRGS